MLPFVDVKAQYRRLKARIDARLQAVLDHGQFILGPEVAELEAALAGFAGARHCIGVASGTDALLLALMCERVGPGDAVFVPAFTFAATAGVVVAVGAEPVFVDVDARTFTMDLADLERRIDAVEREGRLAARAVIPVDLYGLAADYAAIEGVAGRRGLVVVADAAQSFGGSIDGRRVGALAPLTAVSFFPAKPLGCFGDGGAVFTDDAERAAIVRSLRMHGAGTSQYDIVRVGRNARLDTLQAAVLLVKLEVFEDDLRRRAAIADRYDAALADVACVPARVPGAISAWAQYTLVVDARDRLQARLKERGVPTMVYYPRPLHLMPAFAGFGEGPGSLPVCERLCGQVLSLPIHPDLDEPTQDRIVAAVRDALD